jgi:hypothetical protein
MALRKRVGLPDDGWIDTVAEKMLGSQPAQRLVLHCGMRACDLRHLSARLAGQ